MLRKSILATTVLAASILSSFAAPSSAASFAQPEGKVILTVSGDIHVDDGAKEVEFDQKSLEAMPQAVVETTTPWYDGVSKFEGVRMDDLMRLVGAQDGKKLVSIALNDYASEIPIADFAAHGVILAYKLDGKPMDVADKGPLFVIYPFDSDPDLKTQMYYARSVWQVKEFVVK